MTTVKHTLHIVRYGAEELREFITEQFYKHLATSTNTYYMDKVIASDDITPVRQLKSRAQRIKDIQFRIKDYKKRYTDETNEEHKATYQKGINHLQRRLELESNYYMVKQKEEYATTGDVFSTRSFVEFPLNKLINGLYDDFNAIVLYYDNISSNEDTVNKLLSLETLEEKVAYIRENVEVTHIVMSLTTTNKVAIALQGKLNPMYADPNSSTSQVLPVYYANFGAVTLKDCENIRNNDLQQVIQERINMDAEELVESARLTIKGEEYRILVSPKGKEYIRYVCPSTGRVYYNVLNKEYLSTSDYYEEGNPVSYIKSWYSIANLFMELDEEEIARPSIAC